MIKQYIKQPIRSIKKDIYQSSLNIIGLTLGFAAIIYIATYIFHESSFDTFHSKADRIYRVVAHMKMGDTETDISTSENPMCIVAKNELPEIEDASRLYYENDQILRAGEKKFIEKRLWYADKNVFNVFDFELLEGDENTALSQPNSIIVTKGFGEKYLGKVALIGKTIDVGSSGKPYTITGILKDIPENSHVQFDALASYNSVPLFNRTGLDGWGNFTTLYTFILLKPSADFHAFDAKFKELPRKYYTKALQKAGMTLEDFEKQGSFIKHYLQPLTQIHLDKTYVDDSCNHGNKQMLYILGAIGILIIIVACFNFINMATARASLRAKDIGMKKVLGSSKASIILQVLSETFAQALLALFFAVILLLIVSPFLISLSGLSLSFTDFVNLPVISIILLLPFIISLLAGLFPAFVISKFKPVEVMKQKTLYAGSNSMVRNVLVSMQFVVFIVLVAGTIAIGKQLFFMRNSNPGFNKENVLVIENCNELGNSSYMFKDELKKHPEVTDACYTSDVPSEYEGNANEFKKTEDKSGIILNRLRADGDFLNTLKIKMEDGRFFSNKINEEKDNAIINRKAADLLGWTDCVNKTIYDGNGGHNLNVVGIVEDFHLGSLKLEKLPLIIRGAESARFLAIRVQAGKANKVVELARNQWETTISNTPFNYFFLDNAFNAQYKSEARLSKLVGLFSIISALIASLGLLGLVSFASLRRKKEIGVRKVNGATILEILTMLNKDFIIWVAVAFVAAIPIAYYTISKWLENFAYKTEISWWIFALAGFGALAIALLTVSWQSWKSATRNPVEALMYE